MPMLRAASSRSLTISSSESSDSCDPLESFWCIIRMVGVEEGLGNSNVASRLGGLLAFDDLRKSFSLLRVKREDERSREGAVVGGLD